MNKYCKWDDVLLGILSVLPRFVFLQITIESTICGHRTTSSALRFSLWILNADSLIKEVVSSCPVPLILIWVRCIQITETKLKCQKEKKNHFNINASAFETLWRFYAISTDVILWLMHTGSRVGWGGGRSACSQFNLQQCVISTSCFMSRN